MKVLDRKQTANSLEVSVRTVDRYLKQKKLEQRILAGRVFITLRSVIEFNESRGKNHNEDYYADAKSLDQIRILSSFKPEKKHEVCIPIKTAKLLSSEENIKFSQEASSKDVIYDKDSIQRENTNFSSNREEVYKKLFLELKQELKTKQERLEGANYRVGQLEGSLKESVPLLEYKKALAIEEGKRRELESMLDCIKKSADEMNLKLENRYNELNQIKKRLTEEKINKNVFLIILIILFLLQPLWLIFPPVI